MASKTNSRALEDMVLELDFGAGLPKAKRRKVGEACQNCRVKKSKCDGIRPVCGPCARSTRVMCKWQARNVVPLSNQQANDSPFQPTNGDGEHFHLASPQKPIMNSEDTWPVIHSTTNPDGTPHSLLPRETPGSNSAQKRTVSPTVSEQSDGKDAMGNVDREGLRMGVLGTSSSQSFMKSMMEMAEGNRQLYQNGVQAAPAKPVHATTLRRSWSEQSNAHIADYLLPPRKTADRLLEIHWNKSHIIFPWLDRIDFTQWYEGLWLGRETAAHGNESVSHCILNIIFAISYKLDNTIPPEEQETLSTTHFIRAEKLLSTNLLDLCHFELIQALLLVGQYLQSTNMPRQCFQSISLAIWIAKNIHLDSPEAIISISDQRERELACRVWQGCILFDRVMSMTLGQPLRISQETARIARLPVTVTVYEEQIDQHEYCPDQAHEPSLEFFIAYCQLHILLGDILETFYTPDTRPQGLNSCPGVTTLGRLHIDELLAFDDAIDTWRNNLPAHLKLYTNGTAHPVFRRQATSLSLRSLLIRMLLFRPFFSYPRTSTFGDEEVSHEHRFAERIRNDGLLACTTSAQRIIEMISTQHGTPTATDFLPPYWHVVSYIYTAATVVIAAHLHSVVLQQSSVAALSASLRQAFDILQKYESERSSARRCKAALSALCDRIMTFRSRAHSPIGTEDLQTATALNDMVQAVGQTEPFLETDFWNIEDDTDMLWLNSAPFDSNNNFWM